MKPGAPLLHDDLFTVGVEPKPDKPSNVAKRIEISLGDIEAGFKKADVIIEREFKTAPVHQGYISRTPRWRACPKTGRPNCGVARRATSSSAPTARVSWGWTSPSSA